MEKEGLVDAVFGSQVISFDQYKIEEDDLMPRREPSQPLKLSYESVIESRSPFVPNVLSMKQAQDWRESLQSLAPSSKFEPVLPLTVMDKEFLPLDHFLQKPKEETRPY